MRNKYCPDNWKNFVAMCAKATSPEKLSALFDLFFTHEEKDFLTSRFLLVKALLDGKLTQREIAAKYKISISQITRGSNALKTIDEDLIEFLKKAKV
jgi:TrpR family transcriptional regulator, trp operon repressor